MRKEGKSLKIKLHRETLRLLENPEHLEGVAGGVTLFGCPTSLRNCPRSACCETLDC